MYDKLETDFANSSGDEEIMILKLMGRLHKAQKVLEEHAHIKVLGVSIREAFDFLYLRARSLPMVRLNNVTGLPEYWSEPEEHYERSVHNSNIHNRYHRHRSATADAFRDVLIPHLIHSYSEYPKMAEALQTIKSVLKYEKAIKEYQKKNLVPYQVLLMREEFRQNCFKKQSPARGDQPAQQIT